LPVEARSWLSEAVSYVIEAGSWLVKAVSCVVEGEFICFSIQGKRPGSTYFKRSGEITDIFGIHKKPTHS